SLRVEIVAGNHGSGTVPSAYWIDGVQLETGPVATPYIDTNGATATRPAARVQASSAALSATQGWAAVRMRMGFARGASSRTINLFDWRNDTNNKIGVYADASNLV